VLLKQVPATESYIGIADNGISAKTDNVKWIISPYDEFAVEEAIRIKEKSGGSVTVLSAGTEKTADAIRTALAMGADKGVLIADPAIQSCDGLGIAKILAGALKTMSYDLIIAGQRAVDDDNYIVGTAVAEFLDIPSISFVIKQEISDRKIRCQRAVEGGTITVESPLPVLFTTQRGLNEPRYASMQGIMKAKRKPIDKKSLKDVGMTDDLTPLSKILKLKLPPQRKAGKIIEGDSVQAKAAALVNALHEEAKVL
jgi:electron transfer flavoprotein beta subunit